MTQLDPISEIVEGLSREEAEELLKLVQSATAKVETNLISTYFTDVGCNARKFYKKHMAFFKAGSEFLERVLFGGNRVGKSTSALIEVSFHATGLYPEWWEGKRFNRPVLIWEVGKTNTIVKDVNQEKLVGRRGLEGTGLIPKECIISYTSKPGTPGGIQDLFVRHISGGVSQISFKSYDSEIDAFMGSAVDVIHLDEEPPKDIYDECLMRTMTVEGILLSTFTPLRGFSTVVKSFLNEAGTFPDDHIVKHGEASKWVVRVEWDDVPDHQIPMDYRKKTLASLSPHMRDARSKGIPSAGEGMVWPVSEDDYVIPPFDHTKDPTWKRAYGFDVGWHKTAAIFGAYDEVNDIVYIYDEYYMSEQDPVSHAAKIRVKTKGWIPGVIDPSARKSREDGIRTIDEYIDNGLELYKADNTRETGILKVYNRLVTGRLKIFSSCTNLISEIRQYAYDASGNIKGKASGRAQDHACDALRYLIMSGLMIAERPPEFVTRPKYVHVRTGNSTTGY